MLAATSAFSGTRGKAASLKSTTASTNFYTMTTAALPRQDAAEIAGGAGQQDGFLGGNGHQAVSGLGWQSAQRPRDGEG